MKANLQLDEKRKRHLSTAGYWFAEDDPVWILDKNIKVNVGRVKAALCFEARDGFTSTLAYYAETLSSHHTSNISTSFEMMLRTVGSSSIDVTTIINYRATLTRRTEYRLGTMRGFLLKWNDLGYSGVDDEVADLLENLTLLGNIKGDAVKSLDPIKGPLTDYELIAFNEGAVRAFEKEKILISELSLSLLISNTGRRSIQQTHVKICDLDATHRNKKGEILRIINIPRAKQRGQTFRDNFKAFAMTEELWVVLNAQKKHCIECVESVLGFTLGESDKLYLPLFPDLPAFKEVTSLNCLRDMLKTDYLHLQSNVVTATLRKVVITAGVVSERSGEPLQLSARRFRYTIGTRGAREGFGPMIIAELLDQSDISNVSVYTKNVPEYAAALDKELSALMAPYAQAFQGVIVDQEQDARRGTDPCARIRYHNDKPGTCGTCGFCGANVPIPCYTCIHFQALVDGPHEFIHEFLLSERVRILAVTGDGAVAAANDRTILAVAQVIEKCRIRREELQSEGGIA